MIHPSFTHIFIDKNRFRKKALKTAAHNCNGKGMVTGRRREWERNGKKTVTG